MTEIKAHDYPKVYEALGINLATLGCVMLELKPLDLFLGTNIPYYYSPDKEKFWINGNVANKNPHITLLFGLLSKNYKQHVNEVLTGWECKEIEFDHFGKFDSPYPDEKYYCIIGHVKVTPELLEAHQRLSLLPHVNTFGGYKPHITIAYIKSEDEWYDKIIKKLDTTLLGKKFATDGIKYGSDKK